MRPTSLTGSIGGLLLLFWLACPAALHGQVDPFLHFYQHYKGLTETSLLDLSGRVLRLTDKYAQGDDMMELLKKVSRVRVVEMKDASVVHTGDLLALRQSYLARDFELLLQYRTGGKQVEVLIRETDRGIEEVVLTLESVQSGQFVLFNLQGLFRYEDLLLFDLNVPGNDELKELPQKRVIDPRA